MTERDPRAVPPTAGDLMRETELVIPLAMSVGAAARLLEAVGVGIAPVIDSGGRCVGVFTAADHDSEAALAGADEVRHHMTRRFGLATPATGVQELLYRLGAAPAPFLIVLDRQRRPRGIVCTLDVLLAESNAARVGNRHPPGGPASRCRSELPLQEMTDHADANSNRPPRPGVRDRDRGRRPGAT